MLSSSTLSCSPAFGCEPYPIGTMYLHTVALRANETPDGRFPAVRREQTSRKSVSRIGRTFIDSGSANRTLYSNSMGPSFVAMKPPYRMPLNGVPRAAIASTVFVIVSRAWSKFSFVRKGNRGSARLYEAMHPLFGPLSHSHARLRSLASGFG